MAKSPYVHEHLSDDDEVLKDGKTMRVPMMFRDAAARLAPRYDNAPVDAREAAYREMVDDLTTAWSRPTDALRGQKPGDKCTINGAPGHLNQRLECVPDKRQDSAPVYDAAEGQRIKDEAWLEMCRELEGAWRK